MKQHSSKSNSKDPLQKRLLELKSSKTFESFKKDKSPKGNQRSKNTNQPNETNNKPTRNENDKLRKGLSKNSTEKITNDNSRRNTSEVREKSLGNLDSSKLQRIYHRKIFSNEFGGFTGENVIAKITAETGSNQCNHETLLKKTPSKNPTINIYNNGKLNTNNDQIMVNGKDALCSSKEFIKSLGVNSILSATNQN